MSYVKGFPSLFDGTYKEGLVVLVEPWKYAEAFSEKPREVLSIFGVTTPAFRRSFKDMLDCTHEAISFRFPYGL